MEVFYAGYDLEDGHVHNWLVAGPEAIPVPELGRFEGADLWATVAEHYHQEESGVAGLIIDYGLLALEDTELTWQYRRCGMDHLLDLSAYYPVPHYLRTWAHTRIVSAEPQSVTLDLTVNGPADVWLNDEHVFRHQGFAPGLPQSASFSASLKRGHNKILVRFEQLAVRACPYTFGLRVTGLSDELREGESRVLIATQTSALGRRARLERLFEGAYLDQDVYAHGDVITLHWPQDRKLPERAVARLQHRSGRIYAESHYNRRESPESKLNVPLQIPDGRYDLFLLPLLDEYYERHMRISRRLGLWSVAQEYAQAPYGTFGERRGEAWVQAARLDGLLGERAKMTLGRWSQVEPDVIRAAVERVNHRTVGSNVDLLHLLVMLYRFGDHPQFPAELLESLEACILDYRYGKQEPGIDVMEWDSEHQQILFYTCEILAGQRYPEHTFPNAGRTGQWHQEHGELLAMSWLQERGARGFQEWDAPAAYAYDLLALVQLVDLAERREVWERAAVLIDKLLFSLALNSFRGVFGSAHARTCTPFVLGGYLDATAGIGRLLWGMGVFNEFLDGAFALADAQEYQLPLLIQSIATDTPPELWSREHNGGDLDEEQDGTGASWHVDKVTYKTPDYMLCSAQDYRPGEPGGEEHIWQATLGSQAVVFVNHPACASTSDACRPNWWRGNGRLPRVAQWKDVLVAVYKLPADDRLGFTHAYLPLSAFDEHVVREGSDGQAWAFARKGEGYVALTATQGIEVIPRGQSARRELRSYGAENVWLCHMGRTALDGTFEAFQEQILALDIELGPQSVHADTLRHGPLSFGWEGPLVVNGQEQAISGFKHYDNAYCTAEWPAYQMDIHYGEEGMRLDFGE